MKSVIALIALLTSLVNGEKYDFTEVKSYENYQVLRVEVTSKENFEKLSSIYGIEVWNEGQIGNSTSVMVAPQNIDQIKFHLYKQGFKFSVMVENVGDLVRMEKVSTLSVFIDLN